MSCKGKGCSLKSKKVAHKGGTVNLLKTLKKLTVRAGGTVQVRITAADGRVKIARWTARKKKTAKFAAGCVGPAASSPPADFDGYWVAAAPAGRAAAESPSRSTVRRWAK